MVIDDVGQPAGAAPAALCVDEEDNDEIIGDLCAGLAFSSDSAMNFTAALSGRRPRPD